MRVIEGATERKSRIQCQTIAIKTTYSFASAASTQQNSKGLKLFDHCMIFPIRKLFRFNTKFI